MAAISIRHAQEFLALPGSLPREVMAHAMRSFLVSPRGFVGSAEFLHSVVGDEMDYWLRSSADRELFVKHCVDPLVEQSGEHWTLRFFFFNEHDGVESWRVEGRTDVVDEAKVEVALRDGTFRFPFARSMTARLKNVSNPDHPVCASLRAAQPPLLEEEGNPLPLQLLQCTSSRDR